MGNPPPLLRDNYGQPFVIRRYTQEDRKALEEMYREFEPKRVAQGLPPDGEAKLAQWLDSVLGRGEHVLVEVEGRTLGHGLLIPMDGDRAELANFLHQSIRNRGVGTQLNTAILDLARASGVRRVWLSVEPFNRMAIRSYAKAGFKRLPGALWDPEIEMEANVEGV